MATKLRAGRKMAGRKKGRVDSEGSSVQTDAELEPTQERQREMAVDRETSVQMDRARGGVSFWSILSGTLVAFGSFVLLAAIVGSILAISGIADGGIRAEEARTAGIGAAVGLIVLQFLAYLWGGYTAGRMARGSGGLNGFMVALAAIVLAVLLGGLGALVRTETGLAALNLQAFPLSPSEFQDIAVGTGIGLVVAMLAGAIVGGHMGSRWHDKLEDSRLLARFH